MVYQVSMVPVGAFGYCRKEGLFNNVDFSRERYFVMAVAVIICDAYSGQVCVAIYDSLRSMS